MFATFVFTQQVFLASQPQKTKLRGKNSTFISEDCNVDAFGSISSKVMAEELIFEERTDPSEDDRKCEKGNSDLKFAIPRNKVGIRRNSSTHISHDAGKKCKPVKSENLENMQIDNTRLRDELYAMIEKDLNALTHNTLFFDERDTWFMKEANELKDELLSPSCKDWRQDLFKNMEDKMKRQVDVMVQNLLCDLNDEAENPPMPTQADQKLRKVGS